MKLRRLIIMLSLFVVPALTSKGQLVGDCIFLQGKYVEIGIAPNGGYGSTLPAPAAYHSFLTTPQTFYDPGAATTSTSSNFLGFVADYGRDGWTVGAPPFWGDYYLPGTPQEGWSIEINGTSSNAYIPAFSTTGASGFTGVLTGGNTAYSSSGGLSKGVWQGTNGALSIRQTTILDTSKLYFTVNVILKNTTGTALNNIYYMRTLDPDNEQTRSSDFRTTNTISFQLPNVGNKVLVSAVGGGSFASNAYLGLGTKDCRAKCFFIDSNFSSPLVPVGYTLSQIFNQSTSFVYGLGTSEYRDVGVGLVYNIGTIAAFDSTTLTYAYILNASYIDSALNATQPNLLVAGSPFDAGDTIDLCEYATDSIDVTLSDAAFYRWSWSPATNLATTTLATNRINAAGIAGTAVYTVTGYSIAGSCDTVVRIIPLKHYLIDAVLGNPDTTVCSGSAVPARVFVPSTSNYAYSWAPAAGVSNSTIRNPIFTPSVTTTYTLTVSSAVACAPVVQRFTINVISPRITGVTATDPSVCGGSDGSIILYGLPTGLLSTLYYTQNGTAVTPRGVGVSTGGSVTITGLRDSAYTNIYLIVGGCPTNIVSTTLHNPAPGRVSVDVDTVKMCVGQSYLINTHVFPSDISYNYSWTPPSTDLSSATIATPIVTPSAGGDVLYTVTINPGTDPRCNSDTFVVVHAVEPFRLNNRDTAICLGSSITGSISGLNASEFDYIWRPNADVSDSTIINPIITPRVSGTYSVSSTYFGRCPEQVASFHIEVDTPARFADVTDSICLHSSVSVNFVVPGTDTGVITPEDYYSYVWGPLGDLSNDTIGNPVITPSTVGSVSYSVTITPHALGCQVVRMVNIYVLPDTISVHPTDTAICQGGRVQVLGTGFPLFSYQWLPTSGIPISNVLNALIRPDTSATYVVHAYFRGCPDITDTLHLDVQPNPTVYIGGNKFLCQFDTLRLESHVIPEFYSGGYSYQWSPGADLDDSTIATAIFKGNTTTKMLLTVRTSFGCQAKDSAVINVLGGNFTSMVPDRLTFCPHDDTILAPVGPPSTSYRWYPSLYLSDSLSSSPTITPLTTQVYTVVATTAQGCKDTFNFTATVYPSAVVSVEDSARLYPGESYHIEPMTNCSSLLWFPPEGLNDEHSTNPIARPDVSTLYYVRGVTEHGCTALDSIYIFMADQSTFNAPNAFAPGNGQNNKFKIINQGDVTVSHFRIFNRWGNLMFETKNLDEGWDGTYNGKPQPFGVYVYEIEGYSNTGTYFKRHGNITLIR